jgi:hypothetical protein
MNVHEPMPSATTVGGWTWRAPSYKLAITSYVQDVTAVMRRHRILSAVLAIALVLMLYIFRYVYQPLAVTIGIYLDVIVTTIVLYGAISMLFRRYLHDWFWVRRIGTTLGVGCMLFSCGKERMCIGTSVNIGDTGR